jgi:hypothetical protein
VQGVDVGHDDECSLHFSRSANSNTTATPIHKDGFVNDTTIDRFTRAIEAGNMASADVFCADVTLDATTPGWRFRRSGVTAVRGELAGWFADPGHFEALECTPIDGGAVIEFTLTWEEWGVPHACHQAHMVKMRDGRIASLTSFCGGRWPASLLAQMEQAQREADRQHAPAEY